VRRARRTSSSKPSLNLNMKKSISMDAVPAERRQPEEEGAQDSTQGEENRAEETEQKFDELVKNIDKNGSGNLSVSHSASYSTLPQSFSRGKNISRSLVPKMRKFFEKSKSCDPELHHEMPQVKIRIERGASSLRMPADGTESARSSFVLLGPGDTDLAPLAPGSSSVTSSPCLSLDDVSEERARQMKGKGFVNKCVVKVRSLMGRSQELD